MVGCVLCCEIYELYVCGVYIFCVIVCYTCVVCTYASVY